MSRRSLSSLGNPTDGSLSIHCTAPSKDESSISRVPSLQHRQRMGCRMALDPKSGTIEQNGKWGLTLAWLGSTFGNTRTSRLARYGVAPPLDPTECFQWEAARRCSRLLGRPLQEG